MGASKKVVVVMGFLCVVISAAGCANKAVVKKDEPLVSKEVVTKPVVAPSNQKKEEKKALAPSQAAPAPASQQSSNTSASQTAFEKVYFDFDSSDLNKSARDSLTRNSEMLLKEHNTKLSIEGHCDDRGSAEYNLALGERRAKAAANYMKTLGVKPDRLSIISYGKERPAVQGNDEAAWSKNRRDEFVIQK